MSYAATPGITQDDREWDALIYNHAAGLITDEEYLTESDKHLARALALCPFHKFAEMVNQYLHKRPTLQVKK